MRTFLQYTMAKIGIWKPEVGAVYQADEDFKFDPFKPDRKPRQVIVLAIKEDHVQYRNLNYPENRDSASITSFASYYLKVAK